MIRKLHVVSWGLLLLAMGLGTAPAALAEAVCAQVKIEIQQELTLERQAFDAMMRINNGLDTLAIEDVDISVNFQDADGNSVLATTDSNNLDAKFFIRIDSMDNISDVSGAGSVAPGTTAEIHWLIIPSPGAAEDLPSGKLFFVGAHLSYTLGGVEESVDVTPDFITVKPLPKISLDYFLTREVVGDDAFTAEIEPSEPYTLGVRVTNNGIAAARNLKIDSAQPKIIENEQGLAIGFQIISSSIDDQPAQPNLLIDFGEIPGNDARVGRWQMTSTLAGEFVDFDVTFSHADELGGQLTSIIEAAEAHSLIRDVLIDLPGRDNVRDFLAKDTDVYRVYESDGVDTLVADASAQAALTVLDTQPEFVEYRLTQPVAAGFSYVQLTDPHDGAYEILSVTRSDGKRISLNNAWMSRSRDRNANPPTWFYHLNLFDNDSTGSYTVRLGPSAEGPQPPIIAYLPDRTTGEGIAMGFLVESSDPNGDIPILTTAALPAGAAFVDNGDGTGYFNWTPGLGQAGSYVVRFEASDGVLSSSRSMTVTVRGDNDSDGDGMDDDWEMFWFETLARDGAGDFDGDGNTDLAEFQGSTDPARAPGPGQPEALAPVMDEHVDDRYPLLTVQNGAHGMTQTVGYYFEVFADEHLDELVDSSSLVAESNIGMTSWTVGTELDDNKTYHWRARAYDGATYSDWVYGRFFVNTINDAPGPLNISWPPSGGVVDHPSPTLSVTNATDPDNDDLRYTFRVYADQGMTTLVAESEPVPQGEGGTTEWQLDIELADNSGDNYFWTVTVSDGNGGSYEGEPSAFAVDSTAWVPAAPADLYPAAGEFTDDWVDLGFYGLSVPSEAFVGNYYFELDTAPTFDSPNLVQSGPVTPLPDSVFWGPSFGLAENTRYYWRVKAVEGDGSSPWVTSYFTVDAINEAPLIPYAGNPDFYGWSGTLTPTLYLWPIEDPDGDVLSYEFELYTYSREHGVGEMLASAQTNVPEWQMPAVATDYGWYAWRARVIDEHGETSAWMAHVPVYVDNVLQPETLAMQQLDDVTLTEGSSATVYVYADGVSAPICYQVVGELPPFAQFIDYNSGQGADLILNPGYADAGTYSVSIVAGHRGTLCEGEARTPPFEPVQQQITITVANLNRAPVIEGFGAQVFAEGESVALPILASDPDDDGFTITVSGLPAGLAFDAETSTIVGTVDYDAAAHVGSYAVAVQVIDDAASPLTTQVDFDLFVTNTNRPPVLMSPGMVTVSEGQAVNIALSAIDPDGDAVTYVAVDLPAGLAIDETTGTISGMSPSGAAGHYDVTARVMDDGSPALEATVTFDLIIVTGTSNAPPAVALTSPAVGAQVLVGESIMLSANASDSDGSVVEIRFLVDGTEVGHIIPGGWDSGVDWSPSATGSYSISAVAIDNEGASATSTEVPIEVVDGYDLDAVETYFVLNPNMSQADAGVVSLEDDNTIQVGSTVLHLNRYERGTLPASELVQGAIITGTGAFDVGSNVDATDSPVPLAMAGTQFVVPQARHKQWFYLFSPYGQASATIQRGSLIDHLSLPKGQVVAFDSGSNNAVSAIIKSDLPIVVEHHSDRYRDGESFRDAFPVPPASEELWGVKSKYAYIGAVEDDTVVDIYASNGTARVNVVLSAGQLFSASGAGTALRQGQGSVMRIVANKPIGAVQHADDDGEEETAFLPTLDLGTRFGLPVNAQYIVVGCSEENTTVTLFRPNGVAETKECAGNGDFPGKAYFGSTINGTHIEAGAYIETDAPAFVIYESSATNDEHNLLGTSSLWYYVLNPTTAQADSSVVSLHDSNTIRAGDIEVTLDRYEGELLPASSMPQGTVIESSREISMATDTSAADMPVMRNMMGRTFVLPYLRGSEHRYLMLSPDSDASVEIMLGGQSESVELVENQITEFSAVLQDGLSAVVHADRPVLLAHRVMNDDGSGFADATPMPPAAKELWGIGISSVVVGAAEDNTTVYVMREDGVSAPMASVYELNAGQSIDFSSLIAPLPGTSMSAAFSLVANKPIGAMQSGSSNDVSAFVSKNLFATRFVVPTDAQFLIVGCGNTPTEIFLHQPGSDVRSKACELGEAGGRVEFDVSETGVNLLAGSYIEATAPVHVIYKAALSGEEHNLYGSRVLVPTQ